MRHDNGKFLVQLLSGLTPKQILFGTWAIICGVFVGLMLSFYRKTNRRNFRSASDRGGPRVGVDARRLPHATEAREIVIRAGTDATKHEAHHPLPEKKRS